MKVGQAEEALVLPHPLDSRKCSTQIQCCASAMTRRVSPLPATDYLRRRLSSASPVLYGPALSLPALAPAPPRETRTEIQNKPAVGCRLGHSVAVTRGPPHLSSSGPCARPAAVPGSAAAQLCLERGWALVLLHCGRRRRVAARSPRR